MQSVRVILRTIAWSVQRRGVLGTLRRIFHYAAVGIAEPEPDPEFDLQYGTDTDGVILPAEMDVASPNIRFGTRYEATSVDEFAKAMASLPVDPKDFVFVDLGCGKGRALLMASRYPFRRIVGVEYSPSLCSVAKNNIERFELFDRQCQDLRVECVDATSYAFPDEPLVVYMFNPFHEEVMRLVLASLGSSLASNPRETYVVYEHPALEDLFETTDFLVKTAGTGSFSVYTYVPDVAVVKSAHKSHNR